MPQSLYDVNHWNATVFFDGTTDITANLKGVITGLTLPTLERDFDTTKRAGELGVVPRPRQFNEVEASFTVKSVFREFLEALARGMASTLMLTATSCIEDDAGNVIPYVVRVRGFVSSFPFGELSDEGLESEVTMMCYYVEVTLGTFSLIFDPRNYVFSVGGVNIFDNVKTIIDPPTT